MNGPHGTGQQYTGKHRRDDALGPPWGGRAEPSGRPVTDGRPAPGAVPLPGPGTVPMPGSRPEPGPWSDAR